MPRLDEKVTPLDRAPIKRGIIDATVAMIMDATIKVDERAWLIRASGPMIVKLGGIEALSYYQERVRRWLR